MTASACEQRLNALLESQRALTRDAMPAERLLFEIDERVVGSVLPNDAALLARNVPGVAIDNDTLTILPQCSPDASVVLESIANTLRLSGRCGRWRNELLAVVADDGGVLGGIERACARVLGIRTFAVHMTGATAIGEPTGFWLQRRAPGKDVDPGRLDTLAGGLVSLNAEGSAMEAFLPALIREVSEEAGLAPGQYAPPVHVGKWRSHRKLRDGFMVEDMLVYCSRLAVGVVPENRDGEVSEFMRVDRDALGDRIANGELTIAAAIAALMSLQFEGNSSDL